MQSQIRNKIEKKTTRMTDAAIYISELEKQKDKIQTALDQIGQGKIPNMGEIDRDVSALCGSIEIAPPAIAKETETELRAMISMLEDLAGRIQDFQKTLESK